MTRMDRDNQFETEIYHRGVVMRLPWDTEQQFAQGKALLDQLTKWPHRPGELYYLEDVQYEAVMAFRQRLKQAQ
jgi:hypothetical protein